MKCAPAFKLLIMFGLTLPLWGQQRIVPHLTSASGGFTTEILVENIDEDPQEFTFQGYRKNGSSLGSASRTVPAESVAAYSPEALFGAGADFSHFTITGTSPLVHIDVAYQAASGPASPAHVSDKNAFAKTWHLYPGDWSQVFDGIAVVNMGSAATRVSISQITYGGTVMDTEVIDAGVAVYEKVLAVLGGPNGGLFNTAVDVYYEISATEDLAVVALRGTVPGAAVGLLWENTARPADVVTIDPAEGPIAYYPMDGDAQDESGFGNDGILHGAGTVPDRFGRYSRAMMFDGIDDYIEIPHHPVHDLQAHTITLWTLAVDPTNHAYLVCKGDGLPYSLATRNVAFEHRVGNDQTNANARSITSPDGVWHFIACVYNGSTLKIYADGFLQDEVDYDGTLSSNSGPLNIGRNPVTQGNFFNGVIDEVRIFNRALSQQEVLSLFTQ